MGAGKHGIARSCECRRATSWGNWFFLGMKVAPYKIDDLDLLGSHSVSYLVGHRAGSQSGYRGAAAEGHAD